MIVAIIIAVAVITLICLACCKVSGNCSQQEEKERRNDGK